jgi:branched-chain amino acid transport system permease protein
MAAQTMPVGGRRQRGWPGPLSRMPEARRQRTIAVALILFIVAYPFFYRMIPSIIPAPSVNNLIVMMYYAVLALGLNIVVGFAGLLDLGYVAFFVIGAYTTAFLASGHFDIHIIWWLVVWIAVLMAAISGVLLGAPTLRLRGDYLAIVTLGFGEIVPLVFRNLGDVTVKIGDAVLLGPNANLTGGNIGIKPIDPPTLPFPGGNIVFSNTNLTASLYLILFLLVLSYFFCVRLRDSRLGRAWMAIREDETAAAAMGINTVNTKLLAFALGASLSGFAGAFVGSYQTAIFPESFKFSTSITILVMIILGGMGSLRGAILGAFAVQYVNLTFLQWAGQFVNPPLNSLGRAVDVSFLSNFVLHSYNFLIFGIVLVIMMIVRPEGLLPSAARKAELHGEGIAADETIATSTELAAADEVMLDTAPPISAADPADPAATSAGPDTGDLPEDRPGGGSGDRPTDGDAR